jgi:4-hydroxy-tetrahydrodipicolinate reductase
MTAPTLILAGLPGRMAAAVAEEATRQGWAMAEWAISSAARAGTRLAAGGRDFELVTIDDIARRVVSVANPMVVDFTTPRAALGNLAVYTRLGLPVVMGTTGFDRATAEALVRGSVGRAVVAPNMAAPIVALQAALGWMAGEFPGALKDYGLAVTESHQLTKRDVSGTARALLPLFGQLGARVAEPPIEAIRDVDRQRELGVPEEHLAGHGWHWYTATSPGGDVRLGLSHCINGRRVYAEGTLMAARFLAAQGRPGAVYTMQDVLRGGATARPANT